MTSTIDPKAIGKPAPRARRHVRSLTGYLPETDEHGKEKWPRGDEQTWKENMRSLETGASPALSARIARLTRVLRCAGDYEDHRATRPDVARAPGVQP